MDSKIEVVWTAKAKLTFFNILDYLDKNWTIKELKQYNERVQLIIKTIRKNPLIFPRSEIQKNIRKALIDKNNSFFYTLNEDNSIIYILTFFDNRQNPGKLKF